MARGRRASYDSGVILLTRRRDVPVDPEFRYHDSRKAQRISEFAIDDADVITSKSRSKDRQLLDNITQRLVQGTYVEPGSVRQFYTKPPLPRTNNYRRASVRQATAARKVPESVLFIRAGSLPPPPRPVRSDIYEEEEMLSPPIIPPRKVIAKPRPIYRAASEPPPYIHRARIPVESTPIVTTRASTPIVTTRASPKRLTPSSKLAVENARRCLERIERELGFDNGPTIAEPVIVHHVQAPKVAPRATARVAHARTAAPRVRSSSLPPSPVGVPRRSRVAEIEVDDYDDFSDFEDVISYYGN